MNKNRQNKWITFGFLFLIFLGFFAFLFIPKATYSDSERRKLAKKPVFTYANIISGKYMKDFESYMADTFIERDTFRKVKAFWAEHIFLNTDNNGIYQKDGHLVKMDYPYNAASVKHTTDKFNQIVALLQGDYNKVYYSIIPDKGFYLNNDYKHLGYDFDLLEQQVMKAMRANYIPIYDLLDANDYYTSDLHWKQENLLPVANRLAKELGVKIDQEFEQSDVSYPFYGVYAKQASKYKADKLTYLMNDGMMDCKIYDYQNNKEISMFDVNKAKGKDPYEAFLSGPLSYVKIVNEKASSNKKLIVFRDSFSSSLMPLLASGYQEISLIDIRYVRFEQLANQIDANDADILFLYNSYVYNHSEVIK